MFRKQSKKGDVALLILFPILAVILSLVLKANYFLSTILFYVVPALYLSWRSPKNIAKSFVFSLVLGIPFAIIVDSIAVLSKAWITYSMFDIRFFGTMPVEDFVFGISFIYFIIMFYEYLLDKSKHQIADTRLKYFVVPLIGAFIIFLIVLLSNRDLLNIPYAYFWLGFLGGLVPLVSLLSFFPKLISKFIKVGSYFFFLTLLFELTALQLNQWAFPDGQFLGWVTILGHSFPFEELFFWLMLASVSILSYYEFFDDDRK